MDRLTDIDGIGPAAEKALHKAGIATLAALAALEPTEVLDRIEAAGGLRGSPDYHHWVMAARARLDQNTQGGPDAAPANPAPPPAPDAGEGEKAEGGPAAPASPEGQSLPGANVPADPDTVIAAEGLPPGNGLDQAPHHLGPYIIDPEMLEIDLANIRIGVGVDLLQIREMAITDPAAAVAALEDRVGALRAAASALEDAARRYAAARAEIDSGASPPSARRDDGDQSAARGAGAERVTVTGPKKGRWRLGRRFGPDPVPIIVSAAELEQLVADPRLKVELT